MQNGTPQYPPDLPPEKSNRIWGWAALAAVLFVATIASFLYAQSQRQQMDEVSTTNQTLNASLTQLQEQLQSVTERLNKRVEQEIAAKATVAAAGSTNRKPAASTTARAVPLKDPRVDKLQEQLSDQQKNLASAREDLDKTRSDLEGRLDSNRDELNGNLGRAKDELNGSIARTHDDLVALQKRGERNYFEFSLGKAKKFQKVGPVSLELKKVDYKHKSYDLAMMVDDFQLEKKKVNLYEPVWINLTDTPEPVQLIVNQIDKEKIGGYIAAPKYRKSELERTSSNTSPTTSQQAPDAPLAPTVQ
jgi:hypothetical protein